MSSKLIIHDLHYKSIVLRSVGLRSENSTLSLLRSLQMRIKVADQFALPRRYRYVKFKGSWYLKRRRHGNVAYETRRKLMAVWNLLLALHWLIQGRGPGAAGGGGGPGGGPGGPRPPPPPANFQTKLEARMAEKFIFGDWPSPPPPTPLSEGLDLHCVIDICF